MAGGNSCLRDRRSREEDLAEPKPQVHVRQAARIAWRVWLTCLLWIVVWSHFVDPKRHCIAHLVLQGTRSKATSASLPLPRFGGGSCAGSGGTSIASAEDVNVGCNVLQEVGPAVTSGTAQRSIVVRSPGGCARLPAPHQPSGPSLLRPGRLPVPTPSFSRSSGALRPCTLPRNF